MMLPAVTLGAELPDRAPDVVDRIRAAMIDSQSEGTRRAYESSWRRFEGWCRRSGCEALPAHRAVIAAYLVDAAETINPDGGREMVILLCVHMLTAVQHRACPKGCRCT